MNLAQFTIEVLTIVTAAVIGTILAIYLFILKKNGWLGAGSRLYLCPNQECKKVFQKPVELKDLSESPARVYRACPHCGTNLESVLASSIEKKPKLEANAPLLQEKTEMKIEHSASILKDYLNTHRNLTKESHPFVGQGNRDHRKIETGKPEIAEQLESSHKKSSKPACEQTIMLEHVRPSQGKNTEMTPAQDRTLEIGTIFPTSSGCQYGYGYLSQREKGEGIPSACVECPKSLDCMLAEYYKKGGSVKEIKKWYSL